MDKKVFKKTEPKKGAYCKIAYWYNGKKFEYNIYYDGMIDWRVYFSERGPDHTFLRIKLSQLISISENI